MPSQHRHRLRGFRPEPAEFETARNRLEARGETVGAYLRACLRWLARDPDAALAALASDWPGPRPTGRPRGDPPPPAAEADASTARPPNGVG
ncbi:MAG TPA: hypothetical protein VIC57_16680 [Candidatus Dormibacteraeota bacterium]|jgi:hypothetical protein